MAVPKLALPQPLLLLGPQRLGPDALLAADRLIVAQVAQSFDTDRMRLVDLIVCVSVAVDPRGGQVGKDAGYSDLESGCLRSRARQRPIRSSSPRSTTS
jgi:5-formyltetrahydrofolate cyclo-ligase